MSSDARGNPVGAASPAALVHAEQALWRMCSFFDAPLKDIDAAEAQAPKWMLPHVMRAAFLLTLTEPSLLPGVRVALDRAHALSDSACARERAHLGAVQRCAAGDWHGACAAWDAILVEHPRDLYALQWAHLFDFYRGDARNLRHRVARVLPEWPRDDALRPYLLGMYAFGLEECNRYEEAEAVGLEAVSGTAQVPWATHAVAHVMEMQGRYDDGIAWLRGRAADWSVGNGFSVHHWWHLALFHLEALDTPAALALYDAQIQAGPEAITLQRLDAASLLWRLQLLRVDVGPRWEALADGWPMTQGVGHSAFNDAHAMMVLTAQQRFADARDLLNHAAARSSGVDSNATMTREVGLPLMRGLLAFAQERWADAVKLLAPLRERAHRFGGSHAQRDVIDQTLLAAAGRAGERSLARALINERRLAKPATPLTEHWARSCDV